MVTDVVTFRQKLVNRCLEAGTVIAQQSLTLNIPRGVLRGPPLVCDWLTSVEIDKQKIFDTNNA